MVRVHHDEGVANHIGPESCACGREAVREALTGECAGPPLSVCRSGMRKEIRNEQLTAWTSCAKDEGGPLGIGFQEQVPNQSRRRRSKDVVVSVGSKVRSMIRAGEHPRDERE